MFSNVRKKAGSIYKYTSSRQNLSLFILKYKIGKCWCHFEDRFIGKNNSSFLLGIFFRILQKYTKKRCTFKGDHCFDNFTPFIPIWEKRDWNFHVRLNQNLVILRSSIKNYTQIVFNQLFEAIVTKVNKAVHLFNLIWLKSSFLLFSVNWVSDCIGWCVLQRVKN